MATTQQRQKQLDRKANRAGVLSERQARARHAQIARNYFSQKPSISNLYNGAINYLQSKGIITPEGTGLITGVAPAAGRGKAGGPRRTTRRKTTTNRQLSINFSGGKKTYVAPSAGRPNVPATTTEGIQNRLRPQSRTVQTLPNRVTNRLQYHNQQMARGNVHLGNGIYGAPTRRALPAPKLSNTKKPYIGYEPKTYIQEPTPRLYFSNSRTRSRVFIPREEGADAKLIAGVATAGTLAALTGTGLSYGLNSLNAGNKRQVTEKPKRQKIEGQQAKAQQAKAQQEAAKGKEKASADTTQVAATSGGVSAAPERPRTNGGRTASGKSVPRKRKYLDSTPANPSTYTIRRGDTLSDIARRNGTTVEQLARDNGITDVNRIIAGQTLTLNGGKRNSSSVKTKRSASKSSTRTRRPTINRTDVAANIYNDVVPYIAPSVASVNVPYSPEEELLRLRGQYKRGGRVR